MTVWINVNEARELLEVRHNSTVHFHREQKNIRASKRGRDWFFNRSDVIRLHSRLEQRKSRPGPKPKG